MKVFTFSITTIVRGNSNSSDKVYRNSISTRIVHKFRDHHLGCIKPSKQWEHPRPSGSRISFTNTMSYEKCWKLLAAGTTFRVFTLTKRYGGVLDSPDKNGCIVWKLHWSLLVALFRYFPYTSWLSTPGKSTARMGRAIKGKLKNSRGGGGVSFFWGGSLEFEFQKNTVGCTSCEIYLTNWPWVIGIWHTLLSLINSWCHGKFMRIQGYLPKVTPPSY